MTITSRVNGVTHELRPSSDWRTWCKRFLGERPNENDKEADCMACIAKKIEERSSWR